MFEVECPSCKASYQVDERRVPPTGLKMRCPKCGESFQVESDKPPASPVLGAALGLGAARKPVPPKGTMIGMPSRPPSGADLPAVPAAAPAAAPPAGPPRPAPRNIKQTMIGVAPAQAAPLPLPPV